MVKVHPEFLKSLGPQAEGWLAKFMHRIICTNSIPRMCRKAKVIAVNSKARTQRKLPTTVQFHC